MAAQTIDLDGDEWNITLTKGNATYRIDSLVYTSLLLEGEKPGEEPSREAIIKAIRSAISPNHIGLTDHDCWAISVRVAKAMGKAGNA